MNLIKPKYEILPQPDGMKGIFQQIERIGRTCYKSEDKITDDSCFKFVKMLCNNKHGAMLEHGTVCIQVDSKLYHINNFPNENNYLDSIIESKYSEIEETINGFRIYTNLRVIWENNLDLFNRIFENAETSIDTILPGYITISKGKGISVKFTISRGTTHEFVRHRTFSFAQESTRYCNYGKNKFNNELTFIYPSWYQHRDDKKDYAGSAEENFDNLLRQSEDTYLALLTIGWKAQQAREILPHATKADLVMTGTPDKWEHFFSLRDADSAHPSAREMAKPLHKEMQDLGLVKSQQQ